MSAVDAALDAGRAHHIQGDLADAEAVYDEVLAQSPKHPYATYLKGLVLHQRRQHGDALPLLREAATALPDNEEVASNLGNVLRAVGQHTEALAAFDRSITLQPDFAGAHSNRGLVLRQLGRLDEAADAYRAALTLAPNLASALNGLSRCGTGRMTAGDVALLQSQLTGGHLKGQALADGAYALGKYFDEHEDYDQAMAAYRRANSVKRGRFDAIAYAARLRSIIKAPLPIPPKAPATSSNPSPIFICGLPRSGTSLVEQILASHPLVQGAGETNAVEASLSSHADNLGLTLENPASATAFMDNPPPSLTGDVHAALEQRLIGAIETSYICEKSPFNTLYLGPILQAQPDVKIVICERDARDNGLSIYFTDFSNARPFATDMRWIGQLMSAHQTLTNHWRDVLANRVVFVRYEDLIAQPEGGIKRLLASLNLPWDQQCLRFFETERAVMTPSDWQVRQPIFSASVGRWKHYVPWIAPLLDGLGRP